LKGKTLCPKTKHAAKKWEVKNWRFKITYYIPNGSYMKLPQDIKFCPFCGAFLKRGKEKKISEDNYDSL